MCYLRAGDAAGVQLPSPGLRASHCSLLAFLESDGELINSAPAKRSQSLSVGSTSSDAAREDAVEDALRSESRRSHAELGDCGLDSSVAHEEAAICPARSTAREAPAHAFSRELSEDRQGFPGFGKPNSPSTSEAVEDFERGWYDSQWHFYGRRRNPRRLGLCYPHLYFHDCVPAQHATSAGLVVACNGMPRPTPLTLFSKCCPGSDL